MNDVELLLKELFVLCNSEVGWDYYGNDEKSTSGQNTIDDCRTYCRQTCGLHSGNLPVCKYFTYINGPTKYGRGPCWCKTSEAGRTKNHNFGNTITSGGLCESSTTTTTASKFTKHEGYNCFPGAGGEKIVAVSEPYNANLNLADCLKACEDNKDCEGIVMPNDVITYQGGDSIAFIFFGPFFSPFFGPIFGPFFGPFLKLLTEMPLSARS